MSSTLTMRNVPTPCLVIDELAADANIRRLGDYCAREGIRLRPHAKTHKSIEMARRQLRHGATGLTVAKVGEAEVLSKVCDDFLIAYPLVDDHRTERAASLARRVKLTVALDTLAAAEALSGAAKRAGVNIDVLVDLDIGYHRTGVASPRLALELAQRVDKLPGLRLAGIFTYPGHIRVSPSAQPPMLAALDAIIREALSLFEKSGLNGGTVSSGSTPTAMQSHLAKTWTEIRSGTYIYNDRAGLVGEWARQEDCAGRILATVVSDAVPGKLVIDAGSKSLSQDTVNLVPKPAGNGHVVELPNATIVRLSEEHGEVDASNCPEKPKVGSRVQVIPNHICVCVNLVDHAYLKHADGTLEPLPTDARGRVS